MSKSDGGPVMPGGNLTVRDVLALFAPNPEKHAIEMERQRDRQNNPYNDYCKPKLRSPVEIDCQLRYEWADSMLAARGATP